MKLFSGVVTCSKNKQVGYNFKVIALGAETRDEALGKVYGYALMAYPQNAGYFDHKVDVVDISELANSQEWE